MYKIVSKRKLNDTMTWLVIEAPLVARKARPGQFIILRTDEYGERIPLTMAGHDSEKGTIDIIYAAVGRTTMLLDQFEEGDALADVVGPLGKPTHMEGLKRVAVVGGGTGNALAYPLATGMHKEGIKVDMIAGFKNKDMVILEDEFRAGVDNLYMMTDDGSYGEKGFTTDKLKELIESGKEYDEIVAVGPPMMMKFTCKMAQDYGIHSIASLTAYMIDGTGMCGGCRLTLNTEEGPKMKFACVDGPDFNGYEVDFDEAISRGRMYFDYERHAHEETCNLFKMAENA